MPCTGAAHVDTYARARALADEGRSGVSVEWSVVIIVGGTSFASRAGTCVGATGCQDIESDDKGCVG